MGTGRSRSTTLYMPAAKKGGERGGAGEGGGRRLSTREPRGREGGVERGAGHAKEAVAYVLQPRREVLKEGEGLGWEIRFF